MNNALTRRVLLHAASLALLLPRPAAASREELEQALRTHTGGVALAESTEVVLDIAPLIENGNAVPVSLRAPPGTRSLALFSELNPLREVLQARFGPRAGSARLDSRIRLATSQQLVAVAQLADGSWRSRRVNVIVTLAACIEGG